MAHTKKYLCSKPLQTSQCLQPTQASIFSKQVLHQAKIKKEKPPAPPIALDTYVTFGKHKGRLIKGIVHDAESIYWLAQKLKTTITLEVTEAIRLNKFLTK